MCVGFKIQQTTKQMYVFFHSLDEGFTRFLKHVAYKTMASLWYSFLSTQCDHVNEGTQSLVSGLSFMSCALRASEEHA